MQSINFSGRLRDVYQALFASSQWIDTSHMVCAVHDVSCPDTAIQSVRNYIESIVIKSNHSTQDSGFYKDDVPFLILAGEKTKVTQF